jgi:uncharacterized membrane protein YccC
MAEEELPGRPASSPIKGSMRDALRTFIAFAVAFAFTKILGETGAVDLAGAQEALVVIITSGILAFAGKAFRNKGLAIGKVI